MQGRVARGVVTGPEHWNFEDSCTFSQTSGMRGAQVSERFPVVARAMLDPAGAFGRHPLKPHQLLDRVTRIEDTIVLCHLGVPRIDPDDWSLSVDGLVRRPLHLTLSEIKRR